MKDKLNTIYQMDYLEYLKKLPNECVDLVLIDPPYGMTQNKWDKGVDLYILFQELNRIKKQTSPILCFATGLFAYEVISVNKKNFKYDLIWRKGERVSGFLNAKKQPLRNHESILVFYDKQPTYNPQFSIGNPLHSKGKKYLTKDNVNNNYNVYKQEDDKRAGATQKYPKVY
jgi:site-specific DNA-methyltransferase (adenine-specific)